MKRPTISQTRLRRPEGVRGFPWTAWRHAFAVLALCLLLAAGCATAKKPEAVTPENQGLLEKIDSLRNSLNGDKENPELWYQMGNALFDMGRYSEAVDAYQAAVQLDPKMAKAFTNLGLTFRRLSRPDTAIDAYERALEIDPSDLVTIRNLESAAEFTGDETRLLWSVRRLAQLQPQDVQAQTDLAAMLFKLKRYDEAAEVYQHLILLEPGVADDCYGLGLCHYNLEQWDAAEKAWKQALNIDPKHASANKGLAVLYWKMGDYQKAWAQVAHCRELSIPLDSDYLHALERDSGQSEAVPATAP